MASQFKKAWQILRNNGWRALISAVETAVAGRFAAASYGRARAEIGVITSSHWPSAKKFARIYDRKLWLRVNPAINSDKSLSGQGSTLESTVVFRYELECFLSQVRARRLLDIPCGDFNWMRFVKFPVLNMLEVTSFHPSCLD